MYHCISETMMLLLVGARDGCYININIEGPNCAVALKLLIDIMKNRWGGAEEHSVDKNINNLR